MSMSLRVLGAGASLVVACSIGAAGCNDEPFFKADPVPTVTEQPDEELRTLAVAETFAETVEFRDTHIAFIGRNETTVRVYYHRVKAVVMHRIRRSTADGFRVGFREYDGDIPDNSEFGFRERKVAKRFADLATTVIEKRRN